jgi:hypothetical protein
MRLLWFSWEDVLAISGRNGQASRSSLYQPVSSYSKTAICMDVSGTWGSVPSQKLIMALPRAFAVTI